MNKFLFLQAMYNAGYKNQKDFANAIGVTHKVLSNQLNGITKVSTESAALYCDYLGISDEETIVEIFLPPVSHNKDREKGGLNGTTNI